MINACFAYVAIPPCDHVLLVLQVLMLLSCVLVVRGVQRQDSRGLHNLERLLGSGGELPPTIAARGSTLSRRHKKPTTCPR